MEIGFIIKNLVEVWFGIRKVKWIERKGFIG